MKKFDFSEEQERAIFILRNLRGDKDKIPWMEQPIAEAICYAADRIKELQVAEVFPTKFYIPSSIIRTVYNNNYCDKYIIDSLVLMTIYLVKGAKQS